MIKKKIITLLCVILLTYLSIIPVAVAGEQKIPTDTISEEKATSEILILGSGIEYIETTDINTKYQLISLLQRQINAIEQYDNIPEVQDEIIRLSKLIETYNDEIKCEQWANEYPTATKVYKALRSEGYSKISIAGILGNMMAECGGQTLNLDAYIESSDDYYGLCQWSSLYTEVIGQDVDGQINYLINDIEYQFTHYGSYSYQDFLSATSPENAAIMFANCYERCNLMSYSQREKNALIAYNYFL